MNHKERGSRTSSPTSDSRRPSSPASPKQATKPSSPEEGQVTRPPSYSSNREHGRHSGRSRNVNFLKKNRHAVQKCEKSTGVPRTPSEASAGAVTSPPRTKTGQPPVIGDELGTPSNKGSSFFMTAGHNGVREPFKRVIAKKHQNSDS